jgi:hypothetical protein
MGGNFRPFPRWGEVFDSRGLFRTFRPPLGPSPLPEPSPGELPDPALIPGPGVMLSPGAKPMIHIPMPFRREVTEGPVG